MFLKARKILLGMILICSAVFCFVSKGECESDFDVSGIFPDEKGNVAVVNDLPVNVGSIVEGAKVIKITEDGVYFLKDGKQFFQHVRASNSSVADDSQDSLPAEQGDSS